tara:strand:+ start:4206 stop:5315 length:1110 start_codon:yes stop_codon:yes gene_type:complete
MKNLSIIGIGKLGLCFALTIERSGYNVLGCDINQDYVDLVNSKVFSSDEQNVNKYLKESKNFTATTDLNDTINFSDAIFVVVATPSLDNGKYDHKQVISLVKNLKSLGVQKNRKDLVICCTTMPGYCDEVQAELLDYNFKVSYNPEFIAQGTILKNQSSPDMVLIGQADKDAGDLLQEIYERHTINSPRICRMRRKEAEICKISLNCFLTTKIAFANMIGDIAIYSSCDPDVILKAIGSDSRVGNKYLGFGYGYGGPCFPRDNRALAIYADEIGINALVSKASDDSNRAHLFYQVESFCTETNKSKLVVLEYVTYKPESTMLEESQQLMFAVEIAKRGYNVLIRERSVVIDELENRYGDLFSYEVRTEG